MGIWKINNNYTGWRLHMKDKMMEPEVKIDNGELATSMIPEDFTEPEVLFQKLISMVKKYHPSDDVHLIEKAYKIAWTWKEWCIPF